MGTVHLLVNPSSRRGAVDAVAVEAELVKRGAHVERLDAPDARSVADSIDRAAPQRVIAVGGDGLIHHALPALAERDIVLGIVASGTGNDFARALQLPRRRRAAARRALGPARPVDLLRLRFDDATVLVATVATGGFSGRVNDVANRRSFPPGQLKYTVAAFSELGRLEHVLVDFSEPAELSGPVALFAIANTRFFGGGMAIAPDADPRDGQFALSVVGDVPAWQLALVLPAVFIGQHVRHPKVRTATGRQARLEQADDVWADGECVGHGAFSVEVVPDALQVAAF